MVRLKLQFNHGSVFRRNLFQFHNGSIKAQEVRKVYNIKSGFQFHNGSIKAVKKPGRSDGLANFNSTMVRLKRTGNQHHIDILILFQFHNGSIKAAYTVSPI